MVKQLQFALFFFILTLFTTTGYSQQWYDLIHQEPVNIEAVKEKAEKYFDKVGRGKHTGYKQYNRWLTNATMSMDKNGVPYTQNHIAKELKKFRANSKNGKQRRAAGDADNNWTSMGPFNYKGSNENKKQGRITALAVEPIDQQLIFAGSPGGGLWRSRDAGASWEPIGDQFDNMSITAAGIDPYNNNHIVYLNNNSEVFESLDQGDTWRQIANFNRAYNLSKMFRFHPTIPNVYFLTTVSGLMKTIDGGVTFTKVLNGNIDDVFFKPGDVTTMYSTGSDFWKSTNSGDTWTKITNGINVSDRMKMTVTPADPNRVYIIQGDASNGGFRRIYKSTNSGASFEIMADAAKGAENYINKQAWRCMTIMGSTTDPDKLHMGGFEHFRSDDGGATTYEVPNSQFTSGAAYIHVDVLTMQNVNGTLYATSDGGLFRSTDNGVNYIPLAGTELNVTQFFRLGGTSPYPGTGEGVDPDMIIAGCLDNGTKISKGANNLWQNFTGADGQEAFVDYTNSDVLYGSSQLGTLYSSTDGGATRIAINEPESRGSSPTPYTMDPITHTSIYAGFKDLYISKNAGKDWEMISSGQTDGSLITSLAISATDPNYIYFSDGDRLWVSTNAQSTSKTWSEVNVSALDRYLNYITVDPNDPLHALIVTTGAEVYETKNGGQTWNDISGNLPDIKANCVLMDNSPENRMYVGMLQGVYYKDDTMTEWELFGQGLPKVEITELEMHYQSNKLRVTTFGRGIWEIPVFDTAEGIFPIVNSETGDKCSGDSILLSVKENETWTEPISYQWFKNEVLIANATNTNYYALEDGDYTVEVTANEVSGTSEETTINFLETLDTPSVEDKKICAPGIVTLEVKGAGNGVFKWYSDTEGTNELAEGNIFSVDISEISTFYVKETSTNSTFKIGLEDNTDFNGAYTTGGNNLVIDVENEFTLNSVKVYAEVAGDRTFEVRDANAELIVSKTVFVEVGESRVALGFIVPVGNDLTVGIEDDGLKLYRSSGDINYPFEVDGVVIIKGSSVRPTLYYSLYDWEIQTGSKLLCPSPSSEVTVTLDNCVGLSTYDNENLTLFPNPTSGLIHLKLPENFKLKTIEVTDVTGNSLLTHNKYVEQIDLQDFKAGAYLVKVTGEQGIKVFKIEVQ